MNTELFDIKIRAVEGGVTAAAGFKARHPCRIPKIERLDYASSCPINPVQGRRVYHQRFCAAPVQVSHANLGGADRATASLPAFRSTLAYAATGETGLLRAQTCNIASRSSAASPSVWSPPRALVRCRLTR
ncbi:MAG: hypothetical protein ACLS3M_09785 [Collinsella sp.]